MNRPTPAQLEALFWTAELGSVSRAAARLHITQPTLSLRLKQLQAGLPAPLLARRGRGIQLTREGHAFLAQARLVLDAYRRFERATALADLSGSMRIGLAEGFAMGCMSRLVMALEKNYPLLRPEWTIATSAGLEEGLVAGDLDLAVLVDPLGLRGLRLVPLGSQRNCWAAPASQAGTLPARPRDIAQQVVITTPAPTAMFRATIAWFADERVTPDRICMCSSLNAALQLVANGLGVGVFPEKMVEAYPLPGAIRKLACAPLLADGRVFLADRETSDPTRTAAVVRVVEKTMDEIAYFA